MPTDFKRRKHGTLNQLGKPFPVFDGEIPEEVKQRKRACARQWNEEHEDRYQANKRRWHLKKKLEGARGLTSAPVDAKHKGVDKRAKEQFKRETRAKGQDKAGRAYPQNIRRDSH